MTRTGTTTLYRFYDANGQLLYVGMTWNLIYRIAQHKVRKAWWSSVTSATFVHYATRPEASTAEDLAIRTEKPLHNVYLSTSGESHRAHLEARERRRIEIRNRVQTAPASAFVPLADFAIAYRIPPKALSREADAGSFLLPTTMIAGEWFVLGSDLRYFFSGRNFPRPLELVP